MGSEARKIFSNDAVAYVRRVLTARVKLDNWDEKEELIGDCLMECVEKLPKYRGENDASVETFLVTVALRRAFKILEKKYRRKEIARKKWHIIIREGWVVGGHDRPSKEEAQIISAKSSQPSVEKLG
jgi:DNA-directed RNA polymerase specialized sigma24 family protein